MTDGTRKQDQQGQVEQQDHVARSTALMSASTLLSRLTGFIRTWSYAFAMGNTVLTSAYYLANNGPNIIYEFIAGGILTTAFLPIYVAQLKRGGKEGAGAYASNLLGIALVFLGIITLVCATVGAPAVIWTQTFTNRGSEAVDMAVYFFRFFAIQIIAYGIGAIISGMLNAHKEFLWPAIGPVFNNLVVIVTMFGFVPLSAVNPGLAKVWLGVGTSLGVIVQFAVQIPALRKLQVPLRFRFQLKDPAFIETLKLAIPATVFVIVNVLVVSVYNACALGVADNGPSTMSYAWMWYQFPYGVLAVAVSTAMLTEMSESSAELDWVKYRADVKRGLSSTLFLILPMAALMLVLAEPVCGIYQAGEFSSDNVQSVARVLSCWCITMPFYAGYMYLYRAFSAMRDLKLVTIIDATGRVFQAGAYLLMTSDAVGIGLVGIPLTDTVFYCIMFFILNGVLKRKVGSYGLGSVMALAGKTLVASLVAAAAAWGISLLFGASLGNLGMSLLEVVSSGLVGLAVFYLVARLMKIETVEVFGRLLRGLKSRLSRS